MAYWRGKLLALTCALASLAGPLRAADIVVSPAAVTVPEGGTQTFEVSLAGQPAGDVAVTVARTAGDADVDITAGDSLTFTPTTWDTPQTVTLAAGQDDDAIDSPADFTASATGWTSAVVTATESDNDYVILTNVNSVTVPETETDTFEVTLAGQPADDVTVTVARSFGDADLTVSGGAVLTFSPADWNTPQTVTVAAGNDLDALDGTGAITASAPGWTSAEVAATEADDDRFVHASPSPLTVPEGGSQTLAVRLGGQPAADVTVYTGRLNGDSSLRVIGGGSLTFTPANWATPQSVTLSALEDTDAIDSPATFRSSAPGWTSADTVATEVENDRRIVTTPLSLTVPEGGTQTYGVRLGGQPAADVTVGTGRLNGDSSLRVFGGAGLTFTPANWNVLQLVTLSALQDVDVAAGAATFRSGATGWTSANVAATEADDDLHLVVTPNPVTVPEGGTQMLSVRLGGQPATDVTVNTGRLNGDTGLRVTGGASLIFTPANWSTAQNVTLSALADLDVVNGVATFRVSSPGWPSVDVPASEIDDDLRLIVTPTSVTVPEGGTQTYTVRLGGQPAADVTVYTGRLSGDTNLRLESGAALVFTPANWATPQTIRLRATVDSDALAGQATFRSSAAGWPSTNVTATEQEPSASPSASADS